VHGMQPHGLDLDGVVQDMSHWLWPKLVSFGCAVCVASVKNNSAGKLS
jgi:hypothetical protein